MGKTDKTVERRDLLTVDVELRVDGDTGAPTVEGYAAVFDSPSEVLFEWDTGRFREKVAKGAFAKTIREQNIPLLVEHANLPLATTGSGTLSLNEDGHGLFFRSVLDLDDPDVKRLVPKMRRGDMNKCSFGFIPIRETWDPTAKPRMRTVHEARLTDVSIVSRPAYSATEAKVRKVLAEDGLDAEEITELFVRLRMGFELDAEQRTLLNRLAETLNRFREEQTTEPGVAPSPDGHATEGTPPVMEISAPGMGGEMLCSAQHDNKAEEAHPLSWYRERLDRMGA